ncbi:MAG TPA: beta-L-arabinofuranosidase domain-containing protein [Opitutus sp.]|nr:beta-L-arabinofuranosidase domain-containing protein [Opitutus sp.]
MKILNSPFASSRLSALLCGAVLALLFLAAPAPAAPVQAAVADRFVPAAPDQTIAGYLGPWMSGNVEQRLLAIDVDSLLDPFTHRPGPQEWSGEHVGKWLHAASLAWKHSRDPRLKAKLDHVARTLVSAQEPDGYLGTYLAKDRWTSWDVWVHKYALIGLLSYHDLTGDPAALAACRRIGDLLCATFGEGKRDIVTAGEHVGMAPSSVLEPMVKLYRVTGDAK